MEAPDWESRGFRSRGRLRAGEPSIEVGFDRELVVGLDDGAALLSTERFVELRCYGFSCGGVDRMPRRRASPASAIVVQAGNIITVEGFREGRAVHRQLAYSSRLLRNKR